MSAFRPLILVGKRLRHVKTRLTSGYRDLEAMDAEIVKKTTQLKSLKEKLKSVEARLAEMGATESRCLELERRLQEKDQELRQLQQTERHVTRTKLPGSMHGPSSSDSDLARVLEETKAALAASRRDSKRLKRRTTRELSELERIAEEQCQRAGELTEQLALVKRQYAQLKGQVASQTELNEHGRRLEAALAAVRAELEQNLRDEEEALFQLDPTTAQTLYGHQGRNATDQETQFAHSDQTTSDLHRSLLILTNSFHDLCHPSTQQQHSKSLLTINDFTRSTPGLYRPAANSASAEAPPVSPYPGVSCAVVEPGESTVGTCRTGNTTATSGLGSSLNPTASNADLGVRPSVSDQFGDSTTGNKTQELVTRNNGVKDKIIDRVCKQREHNAAEWEQSHAQFRAIRDQVDRVRGQLDGTNGSGRMTSNPRGSRQR
ncbi:unnamed protein product [Echinostoma caproni]|uniref:Uncharacterized protein n=1 Tax=Echinostoma caproni TaxID=27848 RepID=A0A183A7U3_9TREM|nr:unnamed protein product [Echinostoma caproni]